MNQFLLLVGSLFFCASAFILVSAWSRATKVVILLGLASVTMAFVYTVVAPNYEAAKRTVSRERSKRAGVASGANASSSSMSTEPLSP